MTKLTNYGASIKLQVILPTLITVLPNITLKDVFGNYMVKPIEEEKLKHAKYGNTYNWNGARKSCKLKAEI